MPTCLLHLFPSEGPSRSVSSDGTKKTTRVLRSKASASSGSTRCSQAPRKGQKSEPTPPTGLGKEGWGSSWVIPPGCEGAELLPASLPAGEGWGQHPTSAWVSAAAPRSAPRQRDSENSFTGQIGLFFGVPHTPLCNLVCSREQAASSRIHHDGRRSQTPLKQRFPLPPFPRGPQRISRPGAQRV